jgi:hypothetical protein
VAPAIIAVHLSGRMTGIVRRAGTQLAGWRLPTADPDPFHDLKTTLDHLVDLLQPGDRVALVRLPSPTALTGHGAGWRVLRRALLLGALLHDPLMDWAPLLARATAYDTWHLSGYPTELVGPREHRGSGRLRACRAAWDLAGAARPDGPPTVAVAEDRARVPELAEVTEQPVTNWPGTRSILRMTCHVCGHTSSRYVRDTDPAEAHQRYHADFARQHVGWHLQAAGRLGTLLVADTAHAIHQAAHAAEPAKAVTAR